MDREDDDLFEELLSGTSTVDLLSQEVEKHETENIQNDALLKKSTEYAWKDSRKKACLYFMHGGNCTSETFHSSSFFLDK